MNSFDEHAISDEVAVIAIKSVDYNPSDYARMLAQVKSWAGPWMLTTAGECGSKAGSGLTANITDKLSYAADFIPVVGWAASAALSIFSVFRAKHAAAVKRENSVLCQAATESNKILSEIDNLYRIGQIPGSKGIEVLDILVSEFRKAIKPIAKKGNASQWKLAQLIALCEHRKRYEYRTPQPVGSPANPTAAATKQNAPPASVPAPSGKKTLAVVGVGAAIIYGVLALV